MARERKRRSVRREAEYYQALPDGSVICELCPRTCKIQEGGKGFCQVRLNRDGKLFASNYAWLRTLSLGVIQKLPLMEYYYDMGVLTIGSFGCNMTCPNCISWQLVESAGSGRTLYPRDLAQISERLIDKDCIGVAYGVSEPITWYEYVLDSARLIKALDMKNILCTNGVINREPLLKLLNYIDGINLDIKSMNSDYYSKCLNAPLQQVLDNAILIMNRGVHLEITYLLTKGVNDDPDEIRALAKFIREELGEDVPLHLLAARPNGRVSQPETPKESLIFAADIASEYLTSIYMNSTEL